jgi:hypothetical protein
MNRFIVAQDLAATLALGVRAPTLVAWNRLEGRPRRPDFTRALKAEVSDPLWLLARQWQLGEFIGEDASSPIGAKVAWRSDPVVAARGPSGTSVAADASRPLEAMVEGRPVPLVRGGLVHNVDLRLLLGRRFQKLLDDGGHAALVPAFRSAYPFVAPDPTNPAEFPATAHAATWQLLAAVAGRAIDGGALVLYLMTPTGKASDGLGLSDPPRSAIDTLGSTFLTWAKTQLLETNTDIGCWQPRRLEYEVKLSAPAGGSAATVAARDYRGGRLDWYDFDAVPPSDEPPAPAATNSVVKSFLPTALEFNGMPNSRYWAFEEGATNFGAISPDTTDLAKLLMIEFGLVFANDWFLLPLDVPIGAGSLTEIRGLAVTNTFGERFWIEGGVSEAGPTRTWRMFQLSGDGATDTRLFLPGATAATLESRPVETVCLLRDEVSNLVWGLETVVQLPSGASIRGREAALELHAKYQSVVSAVPPATPVNDAKVHYSLMTSVPEHWIPFIPVHIPNDNREIQLQRAAMPRLLEGTAGILPEKVRPRTALLREGMDGASATSYFLAEEEVERSGTVLDLTWQRCRTQDGRVILWLGYQRGVGRGEGSSGLAFDVVLPKKSSP